MELLFQEYWPKEKKAEDVISVKSEPAKRKPSKPKIENIEQAEPDKESRDLVCCECPPINMKYVPQINMAYGC